MVIRIVDKAVTHNLAAVVILLIKRIVADGADIEIAKSFGHICESIDRGISGINRPCILLITITSHFIKSRISLPRQIE